MNITQRNSLGLIWGLQQFEHRMGNGQTNKLKCIDT